MAKRIIISIGIVLASGLLFVNLYTSIVDVTSWGGDVPRSAQVAGEYFKNVNPGHFFRIFSPMNQLVGLLLLIVCWKLGKQARWLCAGALLAALVAESLTFMYFYPRNEIILGQGQDAAAVAQAVKEWAAMNWVRSGLVLVEVLLYFKVQGLIFRQAPKA